MNGSTPAPEARAFAAAPQLAWDDRPAFLLDQLAGPHERRRAGLIALAAVLVFGALAPWASLKLPAVPAFIPIYESALVIVDLITTVLLFGQYRILRSRALLMLGCGYLFTATLTVAHALTFPGLFSTDGMLGAGKQSTAWLYMFWHGGFPLFTLAYVRLKNSLGDARAARTPAGLWPAGTLLLAALLVGLATIGEDLLPPIMSAGQHGPAMGLVVGCVWLCSLASLVVLWRQRSKTALDLWLLVVSLVWLIDIALSAWLNAARFDLGFYAGRIFGLIACSIVLFELLLENGFLYARLFAAYEADHRLSEALAKARDEAQAASAAKSLFLASMSHEIRTPMNAIIGLTHLVMETGLDERQRDHLGKVQTSSKALLTLLNDILDYSKIEAGKLTIEPEEFSPEEIIENVGSLFSARIDATDLTLCFEFDDNIPERLVGDGLRLTQVLNNLVGNAIKFTPRGEIVIRAEAVSIEADAVRLRISVSDTGIGMSEDQIGKLFQVFSQADASITRRYGGTGLGLAICKRLVELLGGEISVISKPGQGSCFSFTANFKLARPGTPRIDLHAIRGMRTLIVDSQPTERRILQQVLQSWRFQVSAASFADEALYRLRQADSALPFELLLVDWKTAGVEFLEAARQLTAERSGRPLAAIALCSLHQSDQVDAEVRELPITGVLIKPVTPSRLFDAIVHLQHGDSPDTLLPASETLSFAETLAPIRGARVLLVEDNLVNQQVALAFLSMAQLQVEIANNGIEAVDRIKSDAFDAVLMDVQMPEMDGLTATRLIRGLPNRHRLPIIAMTAGAMEGDVQDCIAAGMSAHVSKPIDPRELAATLLAWIHPADLDKQPRPSSDASTA